MPDAEEMAFEATRNMPFSLNFAETVVVVR